MTQQDIEFTKRIQYLEYKLEIVFLRLKELEDSLSEENLDEFKEA